MTLEQLQGKIDRDIGVEENEASTMTLEQLQGKIDRDTGVEENEADHRIDEFRDLVRRLEGLESIVKAGFAALDERISAVASIAVDNGAAPMDSQTASEREQVPTETVNPDVDADFLEASWDDLAEALDI
nr:MAG TPA: hypothetical protein [Bacteriophage sp.]